MNPGLSTEAVMTALCARVFAVANFKTTGRRVLLWSKVPEQPACFVRNVSFDDEYNGTVLAKTTLEVEVWIYSNAGRSTDIAPGIELNNLVDAVRDAFKPDNPVTRQCTLGGLVQSCRVEGRVELDPGDLDGQAKAVVPVRVLVP